MNRFTAHALIAGTVLSSLAAAPAGAATIAKVQKGTATANCQGALPSFEGAIRKRPLSVQNEGTTTAFVTCAFSVAVREIARAAVYVNSISNADVRVDCTGVNGHNTGAPEYATKSVIAPASGAQKFISFSPADFGGAGSTLPKGAYLSISCSLPPGAGINDSEVSVNDEIGA